MSQFLLVVRVAVSLAVVLGLLALAARAASKRGIGTGRGPRSTTSVEVIARQSIGRNQSVVVIRAVERALVLGVTDSSIQLLAEADPEVLDIRSDQHDAEAPGMASTAGPLARPPAWKDALEQLRERTVRRS